MNRRTVLAMASGAALVLVMAGSVAASPPSSFHGVFTGAVDFIDCATNPPVEEAGGTWNMAFRADGNVALSVNIFVDGVHHVSFGGLVPTSTTLPGEDYAAEFLTGAGTLRMSISGDTLTYAFPDGYSLNGIVCDNVIYHGTVK